MPLLLIVGLMILVSFSRPSIHRSSVLSYATDVTTQDLLKDTNQQRRANQVADLRLNSKLSAAAQTKAADMANRNYWNHSTPDGLAPWVFIAKAGYNYQKAGENLAYGFTNSRDTVIGWMNSPSHRENLLDRDYLDVGFGYANAANYQGKGPETIVVAMYGTPRITLTPTSSTGIPLGTHFDTTSRLATQPQSKGVVMAQVLTGGNWPWVDGLLLAGMLMGLVIILGRHSLSLHRAIKRGERFVLKHPLFDITIISFIGLCIMLSQTAGFIK